MSEDKKKQTKEQESYLSELERLLSAENTAQYALFFSSFTNRLKDLQIDPLTEIPGRNLLMDYWNIYDSHEKAQKAFPRFSDFFAHLLFWSYGLTYQNKNGKHQFNKAGEHRQFRRKVHLPSLINYLEGCYQDKYNSYSGFNFAKKVNLGSNKVQLSAGFYESFWDNIFNDFKSYRGNDEETICLFNHGNHVLASYLHSAHPQIHYLQITLPGQKNPLCTAILIEAEGGRSETAGERYVIVEGVLGNLDGLSTKEKEAVYSFTWKSIKEFASQRGRNKIFVNTSHSISQNEPHEFVNRAFEEERLAQKAKLAKSFNVEKTEEGLEGRVFRLSKLDSEVINDLGGDSWFTHYFNIHPPPFESYTLRSKDRFIYNGEQYNDTFHLFYAKKFPDKKDLNAFWPLKGYAQGFEVILKPKRNKLHLSTYTAGIISTLAMGLTAATLVRDVALPILFPKPILVECYDATLTTNGINCTVEECIGDEPHRSTFKGEPIEGVSCVKQEVKKVFRKDRRNIKRYLESDEGIFLTDFTEKTYKIILRSGADDTLLGESPDHLLKKPSPKSATTSEDEKNTTTSEVLGPKESCRASRLLQLLEAADMINLEAFRILHGCAKLSKDGGIVQCDESRFNLGKLVSLTTLEAEPSDKLLTTDYPNRLLFNFGEESLFFKYGSMAILMKAEGVINQLAAAIKLEEDIKTKLREHHPECTDKLSDIQEIALRTLANGLLLFSDQDLHVKEVSGMQVYGGTAYFFLDIPTREGVYLPNTGLRTSLRSVHLRPFNLKDIVHQEYNSRYNTGRDPYWSYHLSVTHRDGKVDYFRGNEIWSRDGNTILENPEMAINSVAISIDLLRGEIDQPAPKLMKPLKTGLADMEKIISSRNE